MHIMGEVNERRPFSPRHRRCNCLLELVGHVIGVNDAGGIFRDRLDDGDDVGFLKAELAQRGVGLHLVLAHLSSQEQTRHRVVVCIGNSTYQVKCTWAAAGQRNANIPFCQSVAIGSKRGALLVACFDELQTRMQGDSIYQIRNRATLIPEDNGTADLGKRICDIVRNFHPEWPDLPTRSRLCSKQGYSTVSAMRHIKRRHPSLPAVHICASAS